MFMSYIVSAVGVIALIVIVSVGSGIATSMILSQEVIAAQDLYGYASGNEAAFDAGFTGKTLKVRGRVIATVAKNTQRPWNTGYTIEARHRFINH
jgi:hypothetical protein